MADNESRSLRYTTYDFSEIIDELVQYLGQTNTYKDADFDGSNIRVLMETLAIVGSQNSYYVHAAANEVFLPTARLYKNINKIAYTLRYNARGKTSANLNVVGALNPEYVYGKANEYIEIPAYSVFPSNTPTNAGSNFIFTNPNPNVYIVRGFGIREVQESDIQYKGFSLPFTASASFFQTGVDTFGIEPTSLTLPLSLTKNMSIVTRNDADSYYRFDTENYPLVNPSSNESVGQPFNKTVDTIEYGSALIPGEEYALIFNFDTATSSPYMTVEQSSNVIQDKEDDVICLFTLEATDEEANFYRIRVTEMRTTRRFYVGAVGMNNLESVSIEYDSIPGRPNSVEKMKLVINKDGNSPPFSVLINGKIFTFESGTIESQAIPSDFWDRFSDFYNVNLVITDEDSPETNYGAQLLITSKEPIFNQITIAKIYTRFVDSGTGQGTLETVGSGRFGDLKFVESAPVETTEQKAGRLFFERGETVQRIIFDTPFELVEGETSVEYHTAITPEGNVRTWYANKNEGGFDIYIEPETQFEGYINWTATRTALENVQEVDIAFDQALPPAITVDGEISNYMVQLTPNENIQVWYENASAEGFTIRTERDFQGKISWSVFNYFGNNEVPVEPESSFRQRGSVVVIPGESIDISLDVPITDKVYAIQLIPNKNVNVWYSSRTSTGFTINAEPTSSDTSVIVDWYVDSSSGYNFQKHGEVDFTGQATNSTQIPGLRFVDISETFEINNLLQGQVTFSAINENTVVDSENNGLNLSLDPTRQFETDSRFIVNNSNIASNSIRAFVKDEAGIWSEWNQAGTQYDVDTAPGEEVFFVRVNPEKFVTVEFGDGVVWGQTISNKEVLIFGLDSVGKEGNISANTLSSQVILSRYVLGNDTVNVDFENSLINLIGLKSRVYFQNGRTTTSIVDSQNTVLDDDDISIIQNQNATGGNEVETVDEIRQNATNNFIRQDRNVSLVDYERFVREIFSDNIVESKVLTYEEFRDSGLISEDELSKYWFNYVFIVALNRDGSNVIAKSLRDSIVDTLEASTFKMIGTKHELFPATWVPVDVLVRYKKSRFGSYEQIETQMRKNISDFFKPENHTLGGSINHSDIISIVNIDYVDSVEVMLNKDPNNEFNSSDYNVTVVESEQGSNIVRRNKVMELVAKDPSLIKTFQPLFDTLKSDGTREWNYTLGVSFGDYEFPTLGDIIIEREG